MRVSLVVLAAGLVLAGCGSSPAPPASAVGPTAGNLTSPEQRFITAVTAAAGAGAPVRSSSAALVKAGYAACTALNADNGNPEAAVAAARSDGIDDPTARIIVRTAADDLCPAASAAGLSPTAPASAVGVATLQVTASHRPGRPSTATRCSATTGRLSCTTPRRTATWWT